MDFSLTPTDDPPVSPSGSTSGYTRKEEIDDVHSSSFSPYYPADPFSASRNASLHPLNPTEHDLAGEGSPSFPPTAYQLPLSPIYLPWDHFLDRIDPFSGGLSPILRAPEPSIYPARRFSEPAVRHAVGPVSAGWRDSRSNAAASSSQSKVSHEQAHKVRSIFPNTRTTQLTSGEASFHPEHLELWDRVYRTAVVVNGPRQFVPQTMYQPYSPGDKERYVHLAKLQEPMIFLVQGSAEWGIPIPQLLASRQTVQLVDGNEPAFTSCGPSISIRVQWPGYLPCHKQIQTRDYTHKRSTITKERLARAVARCVVQFVTTMSEQAMQQGSDGRWRVGPVGITVDDVILVSLHHVSQGSWQPHLRVRRAIDLGV